MTLEEKNSSCADSQEEKLTEEICEENKPIDESIDIINETSESSNQETINDNIKNITEDKELYEKILDKLDIKKQENKIESSTNEIFQEEKINKLRKLDEIKTKFELENSLKENFSKIQNLLKSGLINSEQGQNLKQQVLKKAFDKLVQTEKIRRNGYEKNSSVDNHNQKSKIFEKFNSNNPDFFNIEGRKDVFDYLNSDRISIGEDELGKISEIIRKIEKSAIDRYLQKATYEKNLDDSNKNAKQKLTANAQNQRNGKNLSRTFTREQIGKMNSADFTKYEALIMEQLKKGLIK